MSEYIPIAIRRLVRERANQTCEYCLMFRQRLGDPAWRLTLNHLANYNFNSDWNVPVAPEAYNRSGGLFGDQYSNFNAGKALHRISSQLSDIENKNQIQSASRARLVITKLRFVVRRGFSRTRRSIQIQFE